MRRIADTAQRSSVPSSVPLKPFAARTRPGGRPSSNERLGDVSPPDRSGWKEVCRQGITLIGMTDSIYVRQGRTRDISSGSSIEPVNLRRHSEWPPGGSLLRR
jgi:hypothetical protein